MSGTTGTTQNACCVYDFTLAIPESHFDDNGILASGPQSIRDTLKKICKKYCFQAEKGKNNNYWHYQGRFSLKEKARLNQVISLTKDTPLQGCHLSVTSKANRDNCFYVCKDDTRVCGPFTDDNEVIYFEQVKYMIDNGGILTWQQEAINKMIINSKNNTVDRRTINIVLNPTGNEGKTYLGFWLMQFHDAMILDNIREYHDILRMAYSVGEYSTYVFDLPKAMPKDIKKLRELFAAIETLKSGRCYDDRNKYRWRVQPHPNIIVFTNVLPPRNLLSGDRWKIWTIDNDHFVPYTKFHPSVDDDIDILAQDDPSDLPNSNLDALFDDIDKERIENYKFGSVVDYSKLLPKGGRKLFLEYCEIYDKWGA